MVIDQTTLGTGIATILTIIIGGQQYFAKMRRDGKQEQVTGTQADANKALYDMLQEQLRGMKEELKVVKRQLIILEKLAMKAGIDVEQAYRDAGIYDESPD